MTPTPGQTIGPFFGYALPRDGGGELVPPSSPGAVQVHGRVLDGAGAPVPDALLELSQADASFSGWGRVATDADGCWSFTTLVPASPFFALTVFARGLLDRLCTRVYLPEHAGDAWLLALPGDRGATLVAVRDEVGYAFDVCLQGESETVFLSYPRR